MTLALQSVAFYLALASGLGAIVAIIVLGYREFTDVRLEEPGLVLIVLTVALIPACLYTCLVTWIDQRKLAGRLLPAWKVFAALAALSVFSLIAMDPPWLK